MKQHIPIGVVAGITPWNYPFQMAILKIAPALMAGCTVILKPSYAAPIMPLHTLPKLKTSLTARQAIYSVLRSQNWRTRQYRFPRRRRPSFERRRQAGSVDHQTPWHFQDLVHRFHCHGQEGHGIGIGYSEESQPGAASISTPNLTEPYPRDVLTNAPGVAMTLRL